MKSRDSNSNLMILALVAIVAIVAMTLYFKSRNDIAAVPQVEMSARVTKLLE